MKKLGFGLMRMPSLDPNDASKVDIQQVQQMVDLFLEKGFTYFDTAWMYNAFASESTAKTVLVDRHPRESFTLATKLHTGFFNSLETGTRSSTPSWKRPAPGISTTTCSTASRPGSCPSLRSWTASTGCWTSGKRAWCATPAFPITTPRSCWTRF